MCGGGEHYPLHHQRPAEPRSGAAHGRAQQLGWRRGAFCTQVQHLVCRGQLLRGCQSSCQCAKGITLFITPFSHPLPSPPGVFTFILLPLRAFCVPQTPFGASRASPPSQARPLLCFSTSASCWIRASSTSLSPWSFAGLYCSRAASSCWRSG